VPRHVFLPGLSGIVRLDCAGLALARETELRPSRSYLILWIVCVVEQTTARGKTGPLKGASFRIDQHFKTLFNLLRSCRI